MNEPKIELCIYCGEPTGFAGKGEDSLYLDNSGPWCQECYEIARFAVKEVRVQIDAEIKARGEEVLELICKMECSLCNIEGMPSGEPEFGSWFHIINDRAYRCECEFYRQAYRDKYGDTPSSIFGPDGRGVATGANPGGKCGQEENII